MTAAFGVAQRTHTQPNRLLSTTPFMYQETSADMCVDCRGFIAEPWHSGIRPHTTLLVRLCVTRTGRACQAYQSRHERPRSSGWLRSHCACRGSSLSRLILLLGVVSRRYCGHEVSSHMCVLSSIHVRMHPAVSSVWVSADTGKSEVLDGCTAPEEHLHLHGQPALSVIVSRWFWTRRIRPHTPSIP